MFSNSCRWVLWIHCLQRVRERPGNHQVAVPLVVSRHNVPGSVGSRAIINRVLKGFGNRPTAGAL